MSDNWTPGEKKAARVIFDRAIANARKEILNAHRDKKITELGELWDYELEIREWRKEIQLIFQYSYSKLDSCFICSLGRGWLRKEDLAGLSQERIERLTRTF